MDLSPMEWIEKEGGYLDQARKEVRDWVNGEILKKKEWEDRGKTGAIYNSYAEDINPDLLTDEDLRMWNEARLAGDPSKEFREYSTKLNHELLNADEETRKNRKSFRDLLADIVQVKKIREYEDRNKNN